MEGNACVSLIFVCQVARFISGGCYLHVSEQFGKKDLLIPKKFEAFETNSISLCSFLVIRSYCNLFLR